MRYPNRLNSLLAAGCGVSDERVHQALSLPTQDALITFGDLLISSAGKHVPVTWPWTTNTGAQGSLTIAQLTSKWRSGTEGVKLEVARAVAEKWSNDLQTPSVEELPEALERTLDVERALPELFANHPLGPNCLGKFQLLVALGNRFGASMLSISSLVTHAQTSNLIRKWMATQILAFFDKPAMFLSEERRRGLQRIIEFVNLVEARSRIQHFAVAYRMATERWVIVDPNMGLASVAPNDWELDSIWRRLQQGRPLDSVCLTNANWERDCSQIGFNFEQELHRWETSDTNGEIPQRGTNDEAWSDNCYKSLTKWFRELNATKEVNRYTASLHHAAVEVSLALPRVSSATLSHAAYSLDDTCGDEVELELFDYGDSQGHLYNVASSLYRESSIPVDFAKEAMRRLKTLPVLSMMNRDIVRRDESPP
jgi:hypothetical protein